MEDAELELVIKVLTSTYKALMDAAKHEDTIQIPIKVIENATHIPKGHRDLIDRRESDDI